MNVVRPADTVVWEAAQRGAVLRDVEVYQGLVMLAVWLLAVVWTY